MFPCGRASRLKLLRGLIIAGAIVGVTMPTAASAAERLGFVVHEFNIAQYTSRFADECPEGLAAGNDELWWRSLSKQERARRTNNGLNGTFGTTQRGPKGENVCVNPDAVVDPPLRIIRGKYAYGEIGRAHV